MMTSATKEAAGVLCSAGELDLVKTFECGQCFRWNADGSGVYTGVAGGRVASVRTEDGAVLIDAPAEDMPAWREYFDLDTDYEAARRSVETGEYMRRCAAYGAGIRILRQDKWEALCSFIISQCNNIPRIKGIVERLCALFGDVLERDGRRFYSFPGPERLSGLEEAELAPLRSGYRARYIIDAARAVAGGEVDLETAAALPAGEARRELMTINGVGEKVANCAVLFGLHRMDAFPVDTWMKKALRANFPAGFDPAAFGEYAGLAQQYMFYHARSGGE